MKYPAFPFDWLLITRRLERGLIWCSCGYWHQRSRSRTEISKGMKFIEVNKSTFSTCFFLKYLNFKRNANDEVRLTSKYRKDNCLEKKYEQSHLRGRFSSNYGPAGNQWKENFQFDDRNETFPWWLLILEKQLRHGQDWGMCRKCMSRVTSVKVESAKHVVGCDNA